MPQSNASSGARPLDWALFLLAPVFFSSNLIFGRGITGDIAPFTTAFLRWAGSALIIFPFVYSERALCLAFVKSHTAIWLVLGILGMGICGGFVYWALTLTTASNATLIYTTSSLFIILLQWLFQGRRISSAEIIGMVVAFGGVAVIVLKGDWTALLHLRFNIGDFGILAAAIAFALYSLLLRHPAVQAMPPMPLFGLLALSGTLVLIPPALYEVLPAGYDERLDEASRHHPLCLSRRLLLLPACGPGVRPGNGRRNALSHAAHGDHHGGAIPG